MSDQGQQIRRLAARLETLEGRQRTLCRGVGAALVAGLALASLAAVQDGGAEAAVVRARALEIVDRDGAVRARLGPVEDGEIVLSVRDLEDRERLRLGLQEDGVPHLYLSDVKGHRRLGVLCDAAGTPFVVLSRAGGKPAAQLAVSAGGSPSLVFTSLEGDSNAGIGLDPDGSGWILPDRAK